MLNKYGWIILYVSDYLFLLGEKKIHLTLYYGITGKSRDTKLERFLPKNQHTQLLNFENWCSGEVSKSAKI
jgi:hypothetical protein